MTTAATIAEQVQAYAGAHSKSEATYDGVWLRWAYKRWRELTPTHGRRGALAALLREARPVTTNARLIRWQLCGNREPRREGAKV